MHALLYPYSVPIPGVLLQILSRSMVNDGRPVCPESYIFIVLRKEGWPRSSAVWNDRKSMANESSIINSPRRRRRCRRRRRRRCRRRCRRRVAE